MATISKVLERDGDGEEDHGRGGFEVKCTLTCSLSFPYHGTRGKFCSILLLINIY